MEKVYHYTSMKAFLSLIESIKNDNFVFNATNIFFCNDPQEFVYGQEVLLELIKHIESKKNIEDRIRLSSLFGNDNKKCRLKMIVDSIHEHNESPYIISFSRNRDNLPMWLNYGDGGKGVCLEFVEYRGKIDWDNYDYQNTRNENVIIYDMLGTHDVNYDVDGLRENDNILQKTAESIYDYYLKRLNTITSNEVLDLAISTIKALTIVTAPYIKTKKWSYEKEVRLAKTIRYDENNQIDKVQFRCNLKGNIIPYIDIEIPVKQLSSIRIGPLVNKELAKRVLNMIKKRYSNLKFDINESAIEYQNY